MRLNPMSTVLGLAAGFLLAALVAILVWGGERLGAGAADPTVAITIGAVVGALGAGVVAGRFSGAQVFNGAVAGVLFTGSITILSVLDGSPAPTATIVLFVVSGLVLGAIGGGAAHRRATRQP